MSVAVDSSQSARLAAPARGVAFLVEMDFAGGTIRYTDAPINLTIGGNVYLGFYTLTSATAISESEVNSTEKITLSFSVVNQAMLALTLGGVENYRGRAIRIYLQLLTSQYQADVSPILRWSGSMDRVGVTRTRSSPDEGGGSTGKIEMTCSRAGMSRARTYQGLRLTNTQQQQRHPGDRGLEYLQSLIETPALWLSKAFQKQ